MLLPKPIISEEARSRMDLVDSQSYYTGKFEIKTKVIISKRKMAPLRAKYFLFPFCRRSEVMTSLPGPSAWLADATSIQILLSHLRVSDFSSLFVPLHPTTQLPLILAPEVVGFCPVSPLRWKPGFIWVNMGQRYQYPLWPHSPVWKTQAMGFHLMTLTEVVDLC